MHAKDSDFIAAESKKYRSSFAKLRHEVPEPADDIEVEVMELPYIFRTMLENIPAAVPYIEIGGAPAAQETLKVGLAWRGGYWDRRRDVPFSLARTLADVPGVVLYGLQKYTDECDARIKSVGGPHSDDLTTARVMRDLHLVISIDSMSAHLAGALGLPVWTLLR